jgi:hypothetical protein
LVAASSLVASFASPAVTMSSVALSLLTTSSLAGSLPMSTSLPSLAGPSPAGPSSLHVAFCVQSSPEDITPQLCAESPAAVKATKAMA